MMQTTKSDEINMKSHSAFTLLEMLITLSISVILMTLSFPSLKQIYEKSQDDQFLTQLLQTIELAKFEAQTKHIPVSLCKSKNQQSCNDGDWKEGYLIFFDEQEDGIVRDERQIITVRHALSPHGELRWRSYPFYRHYLHFSPTGLTRSDNGTFWHCHGQSVRWAVILNKQARAYTMYPDQQGKIIDDHGKPLSCS
jgi:type IV fimbrial biogenesis protein FimT